VIPHNETFEEKLARRERERERMELEVQQKALERQRLRLGLADFAAGIGDMLKASGGAVVTPRDYQRMYDSLTAQHQKNFDGYLARMQALKEQERAKAKEAADRAYQERLQSGERLSQYDLLRQKYLYDLDLQNRKAQDALDLQGLKGRQALERLQANLNAKQLENVNKGTSVYFEDVNHPIPKQDSLGIFGALYAKVLPYITSNPNYTSIIAGIEDPMAETSADRVRTIVSYALTDNTLEFSTQTKDDIRRILKYNSSHAGTTPAKKTDKETSGQIFCIVDGYLH
jgi:hypothetical protein